MQYYVFSASNLKKKSLPWKFTIWQNFVSPLDPNTLMYRFYGSVC